MQKYFYIATILSLLIGCASTETKTPDDVLSKSQMSDLLVEIHISDALASSQAAGSIDGINQMAMNYRGFILKKYKVSEEKFQKSFSFYKENPVLMDSIYADVLTKLSQKEMMYRGK